ncbi:hypothetical protein MBLNU459_g5922t1 [Dothideomycetes sp. NU459]
MAPPTQRPDEMFPVGDVMAELECLPTVKRLREELKQTKQENSDLKQEIHYMEQEIGNLRQEINRLERQSNSIELQGLKQEVVELQASRLRLATNLLKTLEEENIIVSSPYRQTETSPIASTHVSCEVNDLNSPMDMVLQTSITSSTPHQNVRRAPQSHSRGSSRFSPYITRQTQANTTPNVSRQSSLARFDGALRPRNTDSHHNIGSNTSIIEQPSIVVAQHSPTHHFDEDLPDISFPLKAVHAWDDFEDPLFFPIDQLPLSLLRTIRKAAAEWQTIFTNRCPHDDGTDWTDSVTGRTFEVCVSHRFRRAGKSCWPRGCARMFADKICANLCRPCVVYMYDHDEYWLLPLPPVVRGRLAPDQPGYWVHPTQKVSREFADVWP